MFYAVKGVDCKEVNQIYMSWQDCAAVVLGKNAVYKSFKTKEEADLFLANAPISAGSYNKGYVPEDVSDTIIYGKFCFERFRADDTGYCVYVYQNVKGNRITCKGYHLPNNKRLVYRFTGEYFKDARYGYEFRVDEWQEKIKETRYSVVNYLSCGVIKGIGEKRANLIYDKFGNDAIKILDEEPEKLLKVKGITKKSLEKIVSSYNENKASREITTFLLRYGISSKFAMKFYKEYGVNAVEKIKENPYIIIYMRGLTFEDADRIAKDEHFPADDSRRIHACVFYSLFCNETSGNTGMELNNLCEDAAKRMNFLRPECRIAKNRICECIIDGIKRGFYKHKNILDENDVRIQYIFKKEMYMMEHDLAEDILKLCKNKNTEEKGKITEIVRETITSFGIKYDPVQEAAAVSALSNHLCVITGEPGTGKTTNIRVISESYKKLYPKNSRIFLAPTGRAARKISEAVGENASTIHSYLRLYDGAETDDEVLIKDALVVVDEFSMTDIYVASAIFRAIGENVHVVLVGDVDQLPSVGPGAVLRDIIESQQEEEAYDVAIPIVKLKQIYRQRDDAKIYENAAKINNGNADILDGSDFSFHELSSMEDIKNEMAELYLKRVEEYGLGNVMCLCPVKEHVAGVKDMNTILQDKINPSNGSSEVQHAGMTFRVGDLVMHLKNNRDASNGDIGQIIRIDMDENAKDLYTVTVQINEKEVTYEKDDMDLLTLAYATTVHKSQGSEADAVVYCISNRHLNMLYRNIPYVAISRGKKRVDVFGEKDALKKAVKNENKAKRVTLLKNFLKEGCGCFVAV